MNIVTSYNWFDLELKPIPKKKERPVCAGCQKPRMPFKIEEKNKWHYDGYGYFCTLRCATDYANKIIEIKLGKH